MGKGVGDAPALMVSRLMPVGGECRAGAVGLSAVLVPFGSASLSALGFVLRSALWKARQQLSAVME